MRPLQPPLRLLPRVRRPWQRKWRPGTAGCRVRLARRGRAEATGAKKPVEGAEGAAEEEVELDETIDDAAFIEEQEEEDADVTDIIGGDIENEEEG